MLNISDSKRIQRDIFKNLHGSLCEVTCFFQIFVPLDNFSKNSNFMKILTVGSELFHADKRIGGDMTKLIVAFCNFVTRLRNTENKEYLKYTFASCTSITLQKSHLS